MPGWHEKLKAHVDNEEVVQLGLIQEQHPDRCKLFMQWKQMDWPVMVDSLNLLGVKVVPITLFIDEYGVIQKVRPKLSDFEEFRAARYPKPENESSLVEKPDVTKLKRYATDLKKRDPDRLSASDFCDVADQMFLWSDPEASEVALNWYRNALKRSQEDGAINFRAGVALRRHFDFGPDAGANDFAGAVDYWERSLELDPNHYIRRRRIQQYGPRLDKPYSFYDWVNTAREEITARGDEPVELVVEPGGAEFAYPDKSFDSAEGEANPDPEGKINRDVGGLIEIDAVPVPGKIKPGQASRVHVTFNVNAKLKAHWNNESDEGAFWIDAPDGWSVEKRLWELPNGEGTTSVEERKIEFEVRAPKDAKPGKHKLDCYALYYVCEGVDGTCLYLRQDVAIEIEIRE